MVDGEDLREVRSITKIEYVEVYLKTFYSIWDYLSFFVALPTLSAIILIFVISRYVSPLFYEEYIDLRAKNQKTYYRVQKEVEDEKASLKESEHRVLELEKANVDKISSISESKSELYETWEHEYAKLLRSENISYLRDIIECIYSYRGRTSSFPQSYKLSNEAKGYAHANYWIEIKNEKSEEIIELTEKGKYFVQNFFESQG